MDKVEQPTSCVIYVVSSRLLSLSLSLHTTIFVSSVVSFFFVFFFLFLFAAFFPLSLSLQRSFTCPKEKISSCDLLWRLYNKIAASLLLTRDATAKINNNNNNNMWEFDMLNCGLVALEMYLSEMDKVNEWINEINSFNSKPPAFRALSLSLNSPG